MYYTSRSAGRWGEMHETMNERLWGYRRRRDWPHVACITKRGCGLIVVFGDTVRSNAPEHMRVTSL
eukprot:1458663-Pyramimonas_sp.AAC.1